MEKLIKILKLKQKYMNKPSFILIERMRLRKNKRSRPMEINGAEIDRDEYKKRVNFVKSELKVEHSTRNCKNFNDLKRALQEIAVKFVEERKLIPEKPLKKENDILKKENQILKKEVEDLKVTLKEKDRFIKFLSNRHDAMIERYMEEKLKKRKSFISKIF